MDLHAWITQKVDRAEASAREQLVGRGITVVPRDGGKSGSGTITDVQQTADGLEFTVAQYGVDSSGPAPVEAAIVVLRRCEADRRILARHNVDPAYASSRLFATACDGCGAEGDCDDPVTENLNDCPELLDLAHAHGITDEILAGLDRPQPPEPTPAQKRRLRERARLTVPITTSDVPAALRGPRWKP